MRISDWSSDVCSSDLTNVKYKFGGGNQYLQVGQFKQPNGLEELSSSKNNDFISKSVATNTYAVSRRLGVGYGYGSDDWSVTASWFGRELTRNRAHGSGYGLRGTWAPINDKGHRSEEHTSELQSLMRTSYAVFCLKKQKQ